MSDAASPAGRATTLRWLAVFSAALLILLLPKPAVVSTQGWMILAVFAATMVGLVAQPLPGGAMVFLSICTLAVTGLVPIAKVFTGYSESVVWLVLAAFFISRGMIKTGLGRRIALHFIRFLGKTSLGLAYALGLSDMALGTIIPSTGARSGGIIFPIGKSLAETYDSRPGETSKRLGAFLMLMLYNTDIVVCAMFLTGQASNALIAGFTSTETGIELSYARWMLGAIVPGLIAFSLVPLLVYRMMPPEVKRTPAARDLANTELGRMGPLTRDELIMSGVFALVLLLWLTKALHPIDYVAVAVLGVAALLLTRVLSWDDVLAERNAWDVFVWYGGLVLLAKQLGDTGVTKWFAGYSAGFISGWEWYAALMLLALIYFYAHYGFASITAHATAMFIPFVGVCIAAGAPPILAVLVLAYISNLSASLTHYGTTPAPIYFGAGYVTQAEWWKVGLAVATMNLIIFGTVGPIWWKLLGWW
jgi:DASS family divalent anion:Na+ symporter